MADRRKITTLDKLKVMITQARCPLCNEKLGALDDTDFDHVHALGRGGTDTIDNLRAVHRECHKVKTHGNGATTLRSDAGEMRKTRQLVEKREAREAPPDDVPAPRLKPKAKINSAPFAKPKKKQARATGYRRKGI